MMSFLLLTMVIVGQRMPALLAFFGFFICAILIRTTRVPVILATLIGMGGLACLPVLSPPAYNKLVLHFLEQIRDFPHSPYGQIYIRATNMVYAHPLFGLGFDGFRRHCADAVYIYGMPPLNHFMAGMDPVVGCNIHPHNIYLEIATTAGLIGLMLSMLFITLCMMFWPLASTSSLFTERTAGWAFLRVGWGLALVKSANTQRA